MIGCRSFTETEVSAVLSHLSNKRDRALFLLGVKSGFRISELLSLKVDDVLQYDTVLDRISVARSRMKGKVQGRSVALHPDAATSILELIRGDGLKAGDYLFQSKKGVNSPITRVQAWRRLKRAYCVARLTGKVATHSMRKTFASRVYDRLGRDLVKTQKALGHKSINSTVSYLAFRQEDIDEAVLAL
jgi:integrase